MPSIKLNGKQCFGVRFSPFFPQYLACATTEVFPSKGSGCLVILENDNSNYLKVRKNSFWASGLSDVTFWKNNEDILATGSHDGSVQLWKLFGSGFPNPMKVFKEHGSEVSSIDTKHDLIASSSFDSTIKIWDVNRNSSVMTLKEGNGKVHSVKWSDSFPSLLLSVASNYNLVLWDKNKPVPLIHKVESQNSQPLDCEWNPFIPFEVAVSGSDRSVQIWDIRSLQSPIHALMGHNKAVQKVKWYPHHPGAMGTTSHDLSVGIWDINRGSLIETIHHHSAHVYGFDFSPLVPGETADCSLDSLVHVFTPWSLHAFPSQQLLKTKL